MKNWLYKNKIFFETLAPVCISVAALFVGIASYSLTQQQLKLADQQLKIGDQQLKLSFLNVEPNFYLKETYIIDPVTKRANETELRIYNSGEGVSNFHKNVSTLLQIEHYRDNGVVYSYIPITGYYGISYNSTVPKGELSIVQGQGNNDKFSDVYLEFQTSKLKDKYGYAFISLKHSTKISYTNKLGEDGEAFFIGTSPVSSVEYKKFMSHYDVQNFIDLDDLSINDIEKKLRRD